MMDVIVFKMGEKKFALSVKQVLEIIRAPEVSALPGAPNFIEGIMQLRKHSIAVMDLRKKFNLKSEKNSKDFSFGVVVKTNNIVMTLLVDKVLDMQSVDPKKMDEATDILGGDFQQALLSGVLHHENDLLIMLDAEKLFNAEERQALTNLGSSS